MPVVGSGKLAGVVIVFGVDSVGSVGVDVTVVVVAVVIVVVIVKDANVCSAFIVSVVAADDDSFTSDPVSVLSLWLKSATSAGVE